MSLFVGFPTYNRYRTLQRLEAPIVGEDVFALQTALAAVGASPGTADGVFGKMTEGAVKAAQRTYGLVVDGKAGQKTQTALGRELAIEAGQLKKLPQGLMYGQLAHESGFFLGNYSPQRADGSYDAGVAQRNTSFTPARDGFTVPGSVVTLAANTRAYYDKYTKVTNPRRRWGLAAGAWNAPAYANYLAGKVQPYAVPGPTATQKLEAYISSVTAYMVA